MVAEAQVLRGRPGMVSNLWDTIKKNQNPRYQFLEKVPAECDALGKGLPEMGIDFRRLFTVPTDELYARLGVSLKCRCCLAVPYREELSARFAFYLSRIALPTPHRSDPMTAG